MGGTTVPDGFKYETNADVPGVSQRAEAGTTLAEQVQAKFSTTDSSLASLEDRIAALENGTGGAGWIVIGSGSAPAGHDFTVDLTDGGRFPSPPAWNQIEVRMRLDLTADDMVLCRINGDSDSVYRSSMYSMDGTGASVNPSHSTPNNVWIIARTATAGTNSINFKMFSSDFNPGLHTFQSEFTRESDTSTASKIGQAHGSLISGGKTVTSLQFLGNSTTDFVNCWWTAIGLRLAHPS